MSKKYFVFSDVHGAYDLLMKALEEKGFDINNKNHIIISCGDLMDRLHQPRQCLQFVNKMYDEGRAIPIKGNHEILLSEMLQRGYPQGYDYNNGTFNTVLDMFPSALDINEVWEAMRLDNDYVDYMSHLVDYYETNNYIFCHSWIPVNLREEDRDELGYYPSYKRVYNPDWRDGNDVEWDDYPDGARWVNPYKCAKDGLNQTGKTIVSGHWHCSTAWANGGGDMYEEFPPKADREYVEECFKIWKSKDLIMIDACTAYSEIVNVLVLEEDEL